MYIPGVLLGLQEIDTLLHIELLSLFGQCSQAEEVTNPNLKGLLMTLARNLLGKGHSPWSDTPKLGLEFLKP